MVMRAISFWLVKGTTVADESAQLGPTTPTIRFELLRIPDSAKPTTVLVRMLQNVSIHGARAGHLVNQK